MSSPFSTPSQSAKSEARRQSTGQSFADYYVNDQDGNMPRRREATPVSPKTKKPAVRKHNPATPKRATVSSSEEQSPTRKSPRIATGGAKRTAKAMAADDAENEQPSPLKKRKVKATEAATSTAVPSKKVEPATIQAHTGRFAPIGSQIKRAKKIEKRPADFDEADKPKKRVKKNTGAAAVSKDEADDDLAAMGITEANESDAEVDQASTPSPTKGKGKGKAKLKAKGKKDGFAGTSTNMGTSLEKPGDASNTTSWPCANRNCNTGQTWYPRDGQGGRGRKVISNFFGRNKKETNLIHPDVWHVYCRKDYQRDGYRNRATGSHAACDYFINNIEIQLTRIEMWRPDATFKVQLTKGAMSRLGEYRKILRNNGDDEDAAEKAVTKPPKTNKKGHPTPHELEQGFPIKKMEEFDNKFTTSESNYGFGDLIVIMKWIRDQVKADAIQCMPPMEFLISLPPDGKEATDPKTNYDRWTAMEDGREYNEEVEADTKSSVAGPSNSHSTAKADDRVEEAVKAEEADVESAIAGPSGTQNQGIDSDETEVETSPVKDAATKQDSGMVKPSTSTSTPRVPTPLERYLGHRRSPTPDFEDEEEEEEYESEEEAEAAWTDDEETESDEEPPATPTRAPFKSTWKSRS